MLLLTEFMGKAPGVEERETEKALVQVTPETAVTLQNFTPYLYQQTILATCVKANTLVVLPTGMGKTAISMMLAINRLQHYPKSKILILAPTRPLVLQHLETFKKYLTISEEKMAVFTGFVSPEKRQELWQTSTIIFSTPQGLENDIISGRINLEEISLIVFDEAHKATGSYAYVFVAKQYAKKAVYPRILALTASPGSDAEKIKEICKNLHIDDVELRTEQDPDVKQYVQQVDVRWIEVTLPETFRHALKYLRDCYTSKLAEIKKLGYLNYLGVNKTELLKLQGKLQYELSRGSKEPTVFRAVSIAAEALKIQHAVELLETQGVEATADYLTKLQEEANKGSSKAVQNLVKDVYFKSAWIKTHALFEAGLEHPKLAAVTKLVQKELTKQGAKLIVFTQYRDSAIKIEGELHKAGISAKVFVGQAKKGSTGLSQKQQKAMIEEFSHGQFSVLIATSVAEEGLDIPRVDTVIFYEPIPSAIRHIQRRGRTGRQEKGKVIILVTKDTRDVGYRWSALHKENRMKRTLQDLKGKLFLEQYQKKDMATFAQTEQPVRMFADHREKSSGVLRELSDMGIKLEVQQLAVGDYLLSGRCAVEHKTVPDFVDSIIDGRLLQQLKQLKQSYERPLLLLEGEEDLYSQRNIHPNAIRGMLANITVSYGIPILYAKTIRETAELLAIIARREQDETSKYFTPHASAKPVTLKEQQEYVVSSFPGVGMTLAKPLLEKFGTVKNVVNASVEELKEVEKIGEKKAQQIKDVVEGKYGG